MEARSLLSTRLLPPWIKSTLNYEFRSSHTFVGGLVSIYTLLPTVAHPDCYFPLSLSGLSLLEPFL
jgi:hypothetical protein